MFRADATGQVQMAARAGETGIEVYVNNASPPKAIAGTGDVRPGYYVNASTNVAVESIERVSAGESRKPEVQDALRKQFNTWGPDIDTDLLKAIWKMSIGYAEVLSQGNLADDTQRGRILAWLQADPSALSHRLDAAAWKTASAITAGGGDTHPFYALPMLTGTGIGLPAATVAGNWASQPVHREVEAADPYAYIGL